MKHLIIYTHPNENSFNHAILEEVIQTSKEMGMDVVVRDLYQLKFNPILTWNEFEQINKGNIPVDIKLEQQFQLCFYIFLSRFFPYVRILSKLFKSCKQLNNVFKFD